MNLEIRLLDARLEDDDLFPRYATPEAAAIDLRACSFNGQALDGKEWTARIIRPGDRIKIGTGIALDLGSHSIENQHVAGLILPRSGLGARGITLGNAPGLLDADYQGEITLALWNSGEHEYILRPLDRLAQLLFVPILRPQLSVVSTFSRHTARGDGGFGSTGVS